MDYATKAWGPPRNSQCHDSSWSRQPDPASGLTTEAAAGLDLSWEVPETGSQFSLVRKSHSLFVVTLLRSQRVSGGGVHGLGNWSCLIAVSGRQRWGGVGVWVWLGTRGGSRPQGRLRSSAEQIIFPEKLKPTLFVLYSADASTEETTGISFVGEFGPRAPSPPLPHSLVGERQDFSHCHQLQQTSNHRNATRSPGDNRIKCWTVNGPQAVSLCCVCVEGGWLFCDKGIWIRGPQTSA